MTGEPHVKRRLPQPAELPTKEVLDARAARVREWNATLTELAGHWHGLHIAAGSDPIAAAREDYALGRIDHETFEARIGEILQ